MNVNYIAELNGFDQWLDCNHLSVLSQLLMFRFYALFNRCGWPEWMQMGNQRLMVEISATREETFIHHRDELIEKGLILYKKGRKGCPGKYKLCLFADKSNACGTAGTPAKYAGSRAAVSCAAEESDMQAGAKTNAENSPENGAECPAKNVPAKNGGTKNAGKWDAKNAGIDAKNAGIWDAKSEVKSEVKSGVQSGVQSGAIYKPNETKPNVYPPSSPRGGSLRARAERNGNADREPGGALAERVLGSERVFGAAAKRHRILRNAGLRAVRPISRGRLQGNRAGRTAAPSAHAFVGKIGNLLCSAANIQPR